MQFQRLKLSKNDWGKRMDSVLSHALKLSRNQIQKLVEEGHIHLNHQNLKKTGVKLKEHDIIHYRIPEVKNSDLKAQKIPLQILFEDSNILVINKAPGMVVHPDESGHSEGTVVNAVLGHVKKLSGIGGEKRPGIVHRLDKDTSGVLLIAKNDKTHQSLAKAFHDREIEKTYLALVKGQFKSKLGKIEASVRRGSRERKQMAIHSQGKSAITHFKVLKTFAHASLLEIQIETGRTHQIRLHLASIGHPVLGDSTYGDKEANAEFKKKFGLNRQFLHAQEIAYKSKRFKAPLWDDLEQVLTQLSSF